jgi:hypothetical protein
VTVRPERETLEASIVAHLREWADASQINYPDSQAQGEMRWWMRQAADYIAALAAAPDAECGCAYEVMPGGTYPERRYFHEPGCPAVAPDARLAEALEAALMDANVTYGIINEDGSGTPMMVERQAIVKAMGYEDESAWLARTAAINAAAAREGTRSGGDTRRCRVSAREIDRLERRSGGDTDE